MAIVPASFRRRFRGFRVGIRAGEGVRSRDSLQSKPMAEDGRGTLPELFLFGTPLLLGHQGPIPGRVNQRRRVALLAVLAMAGRHTLSRDRLVAMFWPDSDADRGRHNLADAAYIIRKALGQDVLLTTGDDLRLNDQGLSVDVWSFRRAVQAGDPERAVASYTGPFMEGFHLSGAPEFQHWLDRERSQLRSEHERALEDLAQGAGEGGRHGEALRWSHRLASSDPLNTRFALRLMRAMVMSGDRAGAIRHGEEHTLLLHAELGVEEEAQVETYLRSLRSGPGAPPVSLGGADRYRTVPPAVPSPDQTSPVSAPPSFGPAGGGIRPASASSPGARGKRFSVILAWAAMGVVLALVGFRLLEGPPATFVPDRIVVVPFENLSGDKGLDRLGETAAAFLLRSLVQAEIGDVVLQVEMAGLSPMEDRDLRGPSGAARASREFEAGIAVTGLVQVRASGVEVSAVVAVDGGQRVIAAPGPEVVDPSAPDSGLGRIGTRVMGAIAAHMGAALPEHPFVVSAPTLASFKTADQATGLFLRREYDQAAQLFRRAFDLDNTAPGYLLWEAIAHSNRGQWARVRGVLEELRHRREEFTRFDAAQFDWLQAVARGDREGALAAAGVAREEAPHSGLGGYQFASELYHTGRFRESIDVFLSVDPDRGWLRGWENYWNRLALAHHVLGEHRKELEVAERGYGRHRTARMLDARVRALAAMGRVRELRRTLRESPEPARHFLTAAEVLDRHGSGPLSVEFAEEGLAGLRGLRFAGGEGGAWNAADDYLEARLFLAAGRESEALALFEGLLVRSPLNPNYLGWVGFTQARLNQTGAVQITLARLRELDSDPLLLSTPTTARAIIHAELGTDPVFVRRLLEESYQKGRSMGYFHFGPFFDPVREHPAVRGFFELPG